MTCKTLFRAAWMLALIRCGTCSASTKTEEMRGFWVMRFSLASPDSIRNIVANAQEHNFNTLFVQVRGRGDAWYRSDLEPKASYLSHKSFDPLDMMVSQAHKRGIKVHAWLNTYLVWTGNSKPKSPEHIVNAHPDWIAHDKEGHCTMQNTPDVEGLYLQQSNPEVQEHLFKVFTDVARRYDVDGIHFDFVRYPRTDYDFSPSTLARFKEYIQPKLSESGRKTVERDGTRLAYVHVFPKEWADWRREQVTSLVRRVSEDVHQSKPWVQVSAAVFANADDAYNEKGQDWKRWLAEGYLDAVCPMAYSTDTQKVEKQIRAAVAAAGEKHVYAGIGSWRLPADDTLKKISRARAAGAQGVNLFSYDEVTANGRSNRYIDAVSRGAFPSRAGIPGMRWRGSRPKEPAL